MDGAEGIGSDSGNVRSSDIPAGSDGLDGVFDGEDGVALDPEFCAAEFDWGEFVCGGFPPPESALLPCWAAAPAANKTNTNNLASM